jgi:hypothetical protein
VPRHSEILRSKIDLLTPRMSGAAGRIWEHPNFREIFPEFMFTIHSIIRATHHSMKFAAACAAERAATDPVCAAMAHYLAEHAEEERGHDEWALADLAVMGVSAENVRRRIPSSTVARMVGSQYYWMQHYHPVAYLSYIAVLESPPSIEFLEEKVRSSGMPRDAFRTWFFHGQLDHGHVQEFDKLVDSLPLTDWHHAIMGLNAIDTADMQAQAFEEVVEEFEESEAMSLLARA